MGFMRVCGVMVAILSMTKIAGSRTSETLYCYVCYVGSDEVFARPCCWPGNGSCGKTIRNKHRVGAKQCRGEIASKNAVE